MNGLLTRAPNWSEKAACLDADPELFFHPEHEKGAARDRRDAKAKAVCASCPVRRECLTTAVDRPEHYGLWGGLSETERAPRNRRRAAHPSGGAR